MILASLSRASSINFKIMTQYLKQLSLGYRSAKHNPIPMANTIKITQMRSNKRAITGASKNTKDKSSSISIKKWYTARDNNSIRSS